MSKKVNLTLNGSVTGLVLTVYMAWAGGAGYGGEGGHGGQWASHIQGRLLVLSCDLVPPLVWQAALKAGGGHGRAHH